jgi:hypothetical protein
MRWASAIDFKIILIPTTRLGGRKYRKFPGVAEYVRLIRAGSVLGAQGDFIVWELSVNAAGCLPELIAAFRACCGAGADMSVLAALELAHESTAFFVELLKEGDERYLPYTIRALRPIDTPESRKALWEAENSD